ncbi:MAG: MotA/TolQ/ExbB proton channel family protein [Gammaproteobacteria bacterium]|jgi:biopolymer transport protein ExbB
MYLLESAFIAIRSFFEAGGDVLWAILAVTTLMWTLIIERFWFFRWVLPRLEEQAVDEWDHREDTTSWFARRIRDQMISEIQVESHRYLLMIKTLMAILPLLGLLGTVTGMILVFDVMAFAGTGNARLMAGGVSAATIPTMSGLVAALSGLYLATYLERRADKEVQRFEERLVHH